MTYLASQIANEIGSDKGSFDTTSGDLQLTFRNIVKRNRPSNGSGVRRELCSCAHYRIASNIRCVSYTECLEFGIRRLS
jgi:hypothetical protein